MTILFASNNNHKIEELQSIISSFNLPISLISQKEYLLEKNFDAEEIGKNLEENARIKADALHSITQMPVIADDTGLEVSVLDNAPGVLSARFAGEHGNDAANRSKLLKEMIGKEERSARFRTVLYFKDSHDEFFVEGICSGVIGTQEKGNKGFGYDALFIPDGYTVSFAEMNAEEKNSISHRGRAGEKLAKTLLALLDSRNQ